MIKKEVFIGFGIGILTNILGMLLYVIAFSDFGFLESLKKADENEFLGILIAAGAILNFIPFFFFLNKKKIYRARGVILASILAALCIAFVKIY
ncbi:MAG TPA: hypothetical protein VFI78_07190 [Salinimicrobium sp.]|nr:hypothetical protein [Salinimicrobium sp.]